MLLSDVVLVLSLVHVLHFLGMLFCGVMFCVACLAAWVYDTVIPCGALLGGGQANGELLFCVNGGSVMHWQSVLA